MRALLLALAALTLAPAPARGGDTWAEIEENDEAQRRADEYDASMAEGDEQAMLAASEASSPADTKRLINAAVRAYERAAAARPDAAEPHWRAGNVLHGFFLDCEYGYLCTTGVDAKLFRRVLAHWHAFEAKAPLDPRLTTILFDRAILHTKLAGDEDIKKAILDYEALLDRQPSRTAGNWLTLGNLAESYMMIGDLDAAIAAYREALRDGQSTSLYYGLAVAYDRDDQGAKAREIMQALDAGAYVKWSEEVEAGNTFYVPHGEVYYYVALASEALGLWDDAAEAWQRYLDSGAHPEYQPRARENLAAVEKRRRKAP